jgi:hypothetical protein
MINEQDYQAGWTKPVQHPVTGNMCYGGAARNVRVMTMGGASGVTNYGFAMAVNLLQPVINGYQEQLQASQELLKASQSLNQLFLTQHQANQKLGS